MNLNSLAPDRIQIYGDASEEICIILAGARADEIPHILSADDKGFFVIAVPVDDWNAELSPWNAPPVFGNEPFGNGADELLSFIEEEIIPQTDESYGTKRYILAGYSLAGLFALYGIYKSSSFAGAAAISPSVWFPGWTEYISDKKPGAEFVYLSLGDKEEKTKNKFMSCVGDNIRSMHELLLKQGINTCLEWNEGGHFKDAPLRIRKGIEKAVGSLN